MARTLRRLLILMAVAALLVGVLAPALAAPGGEKGPPDDKPGGGHPVGAGNNLSYPVIWAEGVSKVLRGTAGMEPVTDGAWWYWWGSAGDEQEIPLSCAPDPDDETYCDDGIEGSVGDLPGEPLHKAYLQKDPLNEWQADSADWSEARVEVSLLDWGDNLESVDWYTRSQVRTEVVLIQNLDVPMKAYEMLHTSGWGIDEVHGLSTLGGVVQEYASPQATVYSPCGRLTIQKLNVERDDPLVGTLDWDPATHSWTETGTEDVINVPIFNMAVWEAGDGPGYYSAEINVKGKVIYGYTWNVRKLNEGAADYRITFSLDDVCGSATVNTFFADEFGNPVTEILLPVEEEEVVTAESEGGDTGGGTGVIVHEKNLTYMDIRILERGGGGGGPR